MSTLDFRRYANKGNLSGTYFSACLPGNDFPGYTGNAATSGRKASQINDPYLQIVVFPLNSRISAKPVKFQP